VSRTSRRSKKTRRSAIARSASRPCADVAITRLCRLAGLSRQAYYQGCRARERRDVDEDAVVEQVRQQRKLHPRMGTRKLCVVLDTILHDMDITIGRDHLFALLRERGLLVERRRRYARTTDSRHGFRVWPNRIRHIVPSMPNQVWVSDLTYVRTEEGFMYLSLVTDAFSRKVLGYCISDSLEAQGCIEALRMALRTAPIGACPIHHSDRGTQYCCQDYIALLQKRGCPVSMTEINHCYENAKAERLNGILKDEYALGQTFRNKRHAKTATHEAILLYNAYRPHTRLNFQTPETAHAAA